MRQAFVFGPLQRLPQIGTGLVSVLGDGMLQCGVEQVDAGADVIGDERQAPGLARFLGGLERDGTLPRTILYNANPADNALFAYDAASPSWILSTVSNRVSLKSSTRYGASFSSTRFPSVWTRRRCSVTSTASPVLSR